MPSNLFSVPIFFIAFRECLEASLIIAILLGLVEQIVLHQSSASPTTSATFAVSIVEDEKNSATGITPNNLTRQREHDEEEPPINNRLLIKKLRIQVCPSFIFFFSI
jgi:high-affinity iron transporter